MQWKLQICLLFNIWKRQKITDNYKCYLAKTTFNKSQLGMCMVTRGHIITIIISPGELRGKGKGMGASSNGSGQ